MQTIPAIEILYAIESGDIESIRDNGVIQVLIDLKPVLTIPAEPKPQVRVTAGNEVQVLSGDRMEYSIQADDAHDASEIAKALRDLMKTAR